MKKIVHLSDLHFGAVDQSLINPLIDTISGLKPDLVAVSGDLTQRARSSEFIAAKAFLEMLTMPRIIVPGNHDIPLYNIFSRFMDPLKKYRRYITKDLQPVYIDDGIAVVGLNTARSLTIKDGRINAEQIYRALEQLDAASGNLIKIIVTHHPFDLPIGSDDCDIVGRASLAIKALATAGVDLLLAGHMHTIHTGGTAERFDTPLHSALVIQAGTATSTRHRGEPNSFNLIRTDNREIIVERFIWQQTAGEFASILTEQFYREDNIWKPLKSYAGGGNRGASRDVSPDWPG